MKKKWRDVEMVEFRTVTIRNSHHLYYHPFPLSTCPPAHAIGPESFPSKFRPAFYPVVAFWRPLHSSYFYHGTHRLWVDVGSSRPAQLTPVPAIFSLHLTIPMPESQPANICKKTFVLLRIDYFSQTKISPHLSLLQRRFHLSAFCCFIFVRLLMLHT